VEVRKRSGPTLLVTKRAIQVAVLRQRATKENNGIRAGAETTIRSVKQVFAGGKLPVRGLIRSQMVVLGSALIVNAHRLAHYYIEQASQLAENGSEITVLSLFLY
jgi:IS5 family transposase